MIPNKLKIWLPLLLAGTMIIGMYFGYRLRDNMGFGRKGFFGSEKMPPVEEVVELVRNKYVDNVAIDSISTNAIYTILEHLDPHSVYIPAQELKRANEELEGNFEGVGIQYDIYEDTINVINVIEDAPAQKAGVQVGDKLLKVGDSLVIGDISKTDKVRDLLRGVGGTKVKATFLRDNEQKVIEINRGLIPIKSIDAAYMIEPEVGYIRLNRFSRKAYVEFMESLESLQKKGMKKLILDLRNNGGGLLDDAYQIADEFINGDKLIVYTEGAHDKRKDYKAKRPGLFEDGKLILLVDEFSASASEVVAGALQDWDRATIIGRRTFGKGLVQDQYSLSDGSALRLTIARYYTPVGRNIQKPYDKGLKNYSEEIINRYHNGETQNADSNKMNGHAFKTPGGKTVYGGGGIMPDIFVPVDTLKNSFISKKISDERTINYFAIRYYLLHKKELNSYKQVADFEKGFQINDSIWKFFMVVAKQDSLDLSGIALEDKAKISAKIKAQIARLLWRLPGYFEVYNKRDEIVLKALEEIKK